MATKKSADKNLLSASKKITCWQLTNGQFSPVATGVVIEKEFAIFLNGERLATASLAPGFEKEFTVGYFFGQGFIESTADLLSVDIENNAAKVILKVNRKASDIGKTNYRIVSGGGRSAYSGESSFHQIKSDLVIGKENIFKAMNILFEKAALYAETEGVHAAALFNAAAQPLCIVEDIGRHNTLDKAVGYVLLNNIDSAKTFLVSTGRMASEMVTKICRAGIPIVATKTAVTDKGLEIGKKCGLTVIGFVRDAGSKMNTDMEVRITRQAGMKIYSGADRIRCE